MRYKYDTICSVVSEILLHANKLPSSVEGPRQKITPSENSRLTRCITNMSSPTLKKSESASCGAWEGISLEGKIVYGRIKSYRTNIRSCPSIPEAVFMIVLHPPCCKLLLLQQCSEGWGSCQGNSDWLPMCSTVLTALYHMNLNLYWYLMSTWDINAQPLAALGSWQLQAATRSQVKEQAAAACEVETEMVPLLLTPRGSRTLSWEIRLEKVTAWSLVWLWNAVNLKRCNGLSLLCIQDSLMEIWWSWRAWEWGCTTSTRTTLISFLCAREHDQNFVAWETAFSNTTRLAHAWPHCETLDGWISYFWRGRYSTRIESSFLAPVWH